MNRAADEHPSDSGPLLRVLHVLGIMNRGGIETWLLHMLRTIDRDRFAMDFVVESEEKGDYDEEILGLGSRIYRIGSRTQLGYGTRLRKIIREHGPYDVFHSHHNHYSGYLMRLARREGVATRITHSHTDSSAIDRNRGLIRKLYVGLMRDWIVRYSTQGLAASIPAATSLFGPEWRERDLCRVMHCSVDLTPFSEEHDPIATRAEFGIPADAWVVGHVGRLVDVKNHRLIIDTFAEILPHAENAYLLLVGDGVLRGDIETQARQLGVSERVKFAGNREDVPRILCAAVDAFVFPSKFEGLGMALVEAQAAGLPCIVSDVVPAEADIVPELVARLSLNESWAPTVLGLRARPRRQKQSLAQMLRSDFAIQHGVDSLQRLYLEAQARTDDRPGSRIAA